MDKFKTSGLDLYKSENVSLESCSPGSGSRCESGYGPSNRTITSSSDEECTKSVPGNREPPTEESKILMELVKSHAFEETDSNDNFNSKDIIDLLKYGYIFQATELQNGDLPSVSWPIHELSYDIQKSLTDRTVFKSCLKKNKTEKITTISTSEDEQKINKSRILNRYDSEDLLTKREDLFSKNCDSSGYLKEALLELSKENLLQSLIPFLAMTNSNENNGDEEFNIENHSDKDQFSDGNSERSLRRDSSSRELLNREVTIHVCDDSRNTKKDFSCSQDLLLQQMGYFRDITAGQNLEDVDISVHCDIAIFEWLIRWIQNKNNTEEESESTPKLDANNVMSVLVSASFLKMDTLVEEALKFAKDNMNKVLAVTQSLNCLGEPLLTKLSLMYKPSETEDLLDRRDRLHTKLYIKLIHALVDPIAQPEREIFYSAATLYKCRVCGMFLTQSLSKLYPCLPLKSTINSRGKIIPKHQRDPNFNLNDFLKNLRIEVKSWRRVFWRLWGMTHPLYCSLCSSYFPIYLNEFCSFHPQDPEFKNIQFKNSSQPFGVYPCCQVPVFRYQSIPHQTRYLQGCQSRDHRIKLKSDIDSTIYKILMANKEVICLSHTRKTGIKISMDANSITLPKSVESQGSAIPEGEELLPVPKDMFTGIKVKRSGLVNRNVWKTIYQTNQMQTSTIKKNVSTSSLNTGSSSVASCVVAKFAANRWKKIAYGKFKRSPKQPVKVQSSESSSTTDLSEDSSSCLEDEDDVGIRSRSNITSTGGGSEDETSSRISMKLKDSLDKGKGLINSHLSLKSEMTTSNSETNLNKKGSDLLGTFNQWMVWDNDRPNRVNQDTQRDLESLATKEIIKYLNKSYTASRSGFSSIIGGNSVTNSRPWINNQTHTHIGGSFMNLEQDWRETHMAYIQHRNSSGATRNSNQNLMKAPVAHLRPHSAASIRSKGPRR